MGSIRSWKSTLIVCVTGVLGRLVISADRRIRSVLWMAFFRVRNQFSDSTLLGDTDVVVSLTSHGTRVEKVFYTVESIGYGSARPSRIILWLDDQSEVPTVRKALKRLEGRGLEIKLSKNYGPHTKYYPYVLSEEAHVVGLVTADDDLLYPRSWLRNLLSARSNYGARTILCYRAKVFGVREGKLLPYLEWDYCQTTQPSISHFATGVSGVFYPASFLERLAYHGDVFLSKCARADDIWLHRIALREGYTVAQIARRATLFPFVRGTQGTALVLTNGFEGENDLQIRDTYDRADLETLGIVGG